MELFKKILVMLLCLVMVLTCVACSDSKKNDDDDDESESTLNQGDPNCQHVYGEWTITKEPTCILSGSQKHTCTLCNKEEVETLNYKGHIITGGKCETCGKSQNTTCKHTKTEIFSISKATCTEDGENKEICTLCKEVVEIDILYAKGHDNEYHSYQDATCTEDGWYSYNECTRCGKNDKEVIAALGHKYIAGTCTVCEAKNESFELLEPDASAGSVYNPPVTESSVFTNAEAVITTHSGEIKSNNQVDTYTFVAENNGRYCIWISELYSGNALSVYVKNSLGETVNSNSYCQNNEGFYVENLEVGATYTIEVAQRTNKGTYDLNIATPKEVVDITEYDAVEDSTAYEDQLIVYTFAPVVGGIYRFEFTEMLADTNLDIYILDHLGATVHSYTWVSNGEGITGAFTAGETYQVRIFQRSLYSSYQMMIYKQEPTLNVTEYTQVNGTIKYTGQELNYFFVVPADGNYNFGISNMLADNNVDIKVLNNLGESVASATWVENGESVALKNVKAGDEYVIRVMQRYGTGDFSLSINSPKDAISINSDMGVKGSIKFTDQTDIYNFTADKDGDHIVSISGMTSGAYVYVGIFDANGTEIDYEYCYNNDTIKLTGLKSGDSYTIKVAQDYKLTDYILSVE